MRKGVIMPITQLMDERRQRLADWENAVANMNSFNIPEGFKSAGEKDKYPRFTGYLKEWVFQILKKTSNDNRKFAMVSDNTKDVNDLYFANFTFNKTEEQKDQWWKNAMDIGKGKKVANELTKIESCFSNEKEAVYGVFMPAYRAIKERFDQRSIFQWIFNHEQYVAERDSLKALSAIMTTLTGDTKEQLEAKLNEDKAVMPTSDKAKLERFLDTGVHPNAQESVKADGRETISVTEVDPKIEDNQAKSEFKLADRIDMLLDDSIDAADDDVPELNLEDSRTSIL